MNRGNKLGVIFAWCLYDWACASFSIVVITFIFSSYFTKMVAENEIIGTFQWANATSLAGIIIALISPPFGAIADHSGHHKRWLGFLTLIAIICSAALWFAYPGSQQVYFTLAIVVIGSIGYETAQVFYNAYLPTLAPKRYLGRVSGFGWGAGYIGGIVALGIAYFVFFNSSWLDTTTAQQVRICGPFVALWYGLFALPLFFVAPVLPTASLPLRKAIRAGFKELWKTLKALPKEKNLLLFLIARMIYNDGLNTLFAFGGIYATGTYGLTFNEVVLFGISMSLSAGIGAFALCFMDDFMGSKKTILFSLLCLIIFGVPILFLHDKYIFWAVSLILCAFVGPAQSASRSLMVRLMEDDKVPAEMFGLYALSGRITAPLGPWLLGFATYWFASQRAGMATILGFFIVGGLLLLVVKVRK